MRKGPKIKVDKNGYSNVDLQFDWKDDYGYVMEAVNTRLKDFGLEVLSHESNGDGEGFTIQPIKKEKNNV